MKKLLSILSLFLVLFLIGCSGEDLQAKTQSAQESFTAKMESTPYVFTMSVEDLGFYNMYSYNENSYAFNSDLDGILQKMYCNVGGQYNMISNGNSYTEAGYTADQLPTFCDEDKAIFTTVYDTILEKLYGDSATAVFEETDEYYKATKFSGTELTDSEFYLYKDESKIEYTDGSYKYEITLGEFTLPFSFD